VPEHACLESTICLLLRHLLDEPPAHGKRADARRPDERIRKLLKSRDGAAAKQTERETGAFHGQYEGGYAIGLDFKDLDTDAQTSYGSWRGGGLEGCLITIRVAEPTGLASLFISDVGLVGGSSGSHVIDFQDTTAAANHPEIHATNVGFWGSSDAIVNMGVNSHGRYIHHGGRCVGYTGYAFRASGANTVLRLTNHGSSTTNRVDVASIGDTKDEGTWVL
jgi:hypothetical protein